ncbi:MAG: signal recognition particle protein [Tenericutes bacterium GWC2_34_14]|nr:MAG: signal recognition particle protein [Tenericutes bacterium GWC2_34_14]OHE33665.1 MAG: signal recognition particle protein [Tenericutes bacterium GWE2_34_108]OHE36950.1 MAG: signal recognition particle protein [Tenericutes bacterium GWF1_35_14]OHE37970.1 MAG: signal recognition particle protein [Tenericutes bacterium GWF2_35_184]OHE42039.1 MAG: signal recognition particle protein [Tenericutes bacterium RIFOXYA12_FULL_35_10]OHE43513.1 MAG: signal recognition particle protein [Tenericutes
MAENSLSSRMQMAMRRLTGRGFLTENDIDEMMREVRLSLLEADVNFKVVKTFTQNIKEQAVGEKILKGLNPGQQVVKIVHDELKRVMGEDAEGIRYNLSGITTIMTIGLQGSGKTTAIGKLAVFIRKNEKKNVLLIAADVYRPAAIEQLQTIGKQIDVEVFERGLIDARDIVKQGLAYAKEKKFDVVIIDTAGRLHIDEKMMQELVDVKEIAKPNEILLTVDAMTGQDAANICKSFHEQLDATGAILTKLDGDTRGGAALSIKEVSGIPIKFASSGEKMDSFEVFHPERMASRILGMGDVLTLIEKATDAIDEDDAKNMMEKLMSDTFNYNDLMKQFKMIKRMGSVSKILGFLPGVGQMKQAMSQVDDKQFDKMSALISSMTEDERKDPKLIDTSSRRRERIARGSGMSVADLNRLRQALEAQKKMMKQMSNMDERQLNSLQKNPSQLMGQQKVKKGKGKGKGQFRVR